MSRRLAEPFATISEERFGQIERLWEQGLAEEPSLYSLVLQDVHSFSPVVVGGIGKMVRATENIRIPVQLLTRLRSEKRFSEALIEFLRPLRLLVDIFATSEGEIVFPGTPVLQIYGRAVDCMLFADFARACDEKGSQAATLAYWCRRHARGSRLFLDGGSMPYDAMVADGCRIAGWDGHIAQEAHADSRLNLIEPGDANDAVKPEGAQDFLDKTRGSRLKVSLDPIQLLARETPIEWRESFSQLPETVVPGTFRVARVFSEHGDSEIDRVIVEAEALPPGARPMLERYTDRGRICRPLPEPARSAVLLLRAESELDEDYAQHRSAWSEQAKALWLGQAEQ